MNDNIKNDIITKSRMKIAISNLETEELKRPKKNLSKLVATFILTIGTTAGLVYAGNAVYEKIWKEPISYQATQEITEEEKAECISEEEAKKIGSEYFKKIGLSNDESIQNITLERNWSEKENNWFMTYGKASLEIDGKTGNLKSVSIPTNNYTIAEKYAITKQEAKKVANELLEKYKPQNSQGTYELLSLRGNSSEADSYIWYAEFYKKYDDLINPAEKILIGWIPTINSLYCLEISNYAYENNEQIISKEEATEIAKNKEKQINPEGQIKNIQAEIKIEQMNESVFLREKYGKDYESGKWNKEKIGENGYKLKNDAVFYKTDGRVRKVWRVTMEYEKIDKDNLLHYYSYYIDATTGEIIGGEIGDLLTYEDNLKLDVYNMA